MSTNSYYAPLQNNMNLMIPHLYTRVSFILGPHTCLFAAYLGLFVLLFSLFITVWLFCRVSGFLLSSQSWVFFFYTFESFCISSCFFS